MLSDDAARWARMGAGSHLDDWLAYQPGPGIRRKLAMQIAFTNNYAKAFGALMQADGLSITWT